MFTSKSREERQSFWKGVVGCGEDFCLETSIHGFNHIAEPRRHWAERVLWAGVLCTAAWGAADVALDQVQRYRESPTVVTLEKDFRAWSCSLPAVTVCYPDKVDPTKLVDAIRARWNVSPSDERFGYYQRFVATVANSDLFHLQDYEQFAGDKTLDVDLRKLVVDVMIDNEVKVFSSLTLDERWVPVMTESGICFTINSLAIADVALMKPVNVSGVPYMCKYTSMACWIMFEVSVNNVDFYVHSPYDVADMTATPSRVCLALVRITDLRVMETRAGSGVRQLQPRRRRCLYTDEPTDANRQVYSTNTCRLACRSRLAFQLCGCVPFYYFYDEGPSCSPSGMLCLASHAAKLASVHCACEQQCVDALYRELSTEDQLWKNAVVFESRGSVRFAVEAPRARYTREIVFHFQDLVVSFGGAAGLFLGASFISFVEIVYFLLHRCLRLFAVVEDTKPERVKNFRVPFETTRIEEITAVLNEEKTNENDFKYYVNYKF